MNIDTLRYWHKLEHFYPYILEEQRDKKINTYSVEVASDYPDYNDPEIEDDMMVRYYEVYLGIFKVDSALKVLAEKINAEKEFRDESDETSCFCKIRLDAQGGFDEEQFRISSFPWAIHRVKDNAIDLEQWDDDFQDYQRTFFLRFFNCHKVLTYEIFEEILQDIKNSINWDIEFETCWMRVDRVVGEKTSTSKGQNEDEAEEQADIESCMEADLEIAQENERIDTLIKANDLLNSFYVRDLERVLEHVNSNDYGQALDSYVDHQRDGEVNVEENKEELLKIFNPKYLPLGKWPSGYGLRAMQQVSVNLALSDLCANNVFSVNGPPGTGKTTLLRDIIAAKEVERAIKLLDLETPDDAFESSIGELTYNNFKTVIRPLRPELQNYGILIASNNNTAVQNISEELPLKGSIHERYREDYSYFPEVSDRLRGKENDTWGIVAAVLGNYKNRTKFANNFWPVFDKEEAGFKFHCYLKKLQSNKEPMHFKTDWENAKSRFRNIYKQVQDAYADMQQCYGYILKAQELELLLSKSRKEIEILYKRKAEAEMQYNRLGENIRYKESLCLSKENAKKEIKRNTVFFFIRYLFPNSLKEYKQLEREVNALILEKAELNSQLVKQVEIIRRITEALEQANSEYDILWNKQKEYKNFVVEWGHTNESEVPNEEYFAKLISEDKEVKKTAQMVSPWNGARIIELRERLYLEAVNLHKAFVENSGVLYRQLDAFYKIIAMKVPQEQAINYASVLFQSFQMVVPVISTTFASVGTFLKHVGRDTFGLLLIDEAGQALPQSAVGAIWRAQKTVIVGDPLQIEPVVTIHDKTIQFLKTYFHQTDFIASKETSVQSLADGCNRFGGLRYYNDVPMWIGSPLLVHGRCQKNIFDIANIIAYNKKMIYGTKDEDDTDCRWIHVKGTATEKHFVLEQAEKILEQIVPLFKKTIEEKKEAPSLFIITPFRSVKAGLIKWFSKDERLCNQIDPDMDKEKKDTIKDWMHKNIGTIHTFQGKEADRVIIALGVDSGDKGYGAIQWASQKPNILNVAVTRAKKHLCIVGDENKWAHQPNFDKAYRICCDEGKEDEEEA